MLKGYRKTIKDQVLWGLQDILNKIKPVKNEVIAGTKKEKQDWAMKEMEAMDKCYKVEDWIRKNYKEIAYVLVSTVLIFIIWLLLVELKEQKALTEKIVEQCWPWIKHK